MDKITNHRKDDIPEYNNNTCLEKCKPVHDCDSEFSLELRRLVHYLNSEFEKIEDSCDKSKYSFCKVIDGLRRLLCLLNNPNFGLEEIKDEVRNIENKIENPHFGLAEIKEEVANIESTINIVASQIGYISGEVFNIEHKLDNPSFGLAEIKEEVANIESTINICASQMGCLTSDVIRIGSTPDYSLAEIKNEAKEVLTITDSYEEPANYTTGICSADSSANSLVSIIHNSTSSPKTASINTSVYFATVGVQPAQQNCGSKQLCPLDGSDKDIIIPPNCTIFRVYSLNPSNTNPLGILFEVQYTGLCSEVTAFTAARINPAASPIESSSWISSNVFRFSDLSHS